MCDCCDSTILTIPTGTDGVSVSSITLNGSNQLVITYSDGSSTTTSAITVTDSGSKIINNDATAETEDIYTPSAPTQIGTKTYDMPAATLSSDGSEARVRAIITLNMTDKASRYVFWIYVEGAWFISTAIYPGFEVVWQGADSYQVELNLTLVRISNTTLAIYFEGQLMGYLGQVPVKGQSAYYKDQPTTLPAINFTTDAITFAVYGQSFSSTDTDVTCTNFMVEKILK